MQGGIYTIENLITGALYVGSAKNFTSRWKDHLADLRKNKHINIHLQRSFDKHGEAVFKFSVFECLGAYVKQEYFDHENKAMQELRTAGKQLYNIAKAEGGWSYHDDNVKRSIAIKISKTLKETNASLSKLERHEKYTIYSKDNPIPIETRLKISKTMKGVPKTEQTKANMKLGQIPLADAKRITMRKVGLKNKGRLPFNTRRVMLNDGSIYPSLTAAADHFGKSSSWLLKKLKQNELGQYIT